MKNSDLRATARNFFDIGVKAADPTIAVRNELSAVPIEMVSGRIHIVSIGKAAVPMLEEALKHLPMNASFQAIAVTNIENAKNIPRVKIFAAGHPIPDQEGLNASQYLTSQLRNIHADDFVLCLISGGGSALLPAPIKGVSLADKIQTNALLLASGLDIEKMNLVRQHLSQFKGGGLAALCHPAKVRSLLISDVIGDDPRAIASGPTAAKIGTLHQAKQVLIDANIWDQLPISVQRHLSAPEIEGTTQPTNAQNQIIASNRQSLKAIQNAAKPWNPLIVKHDLSGDVGQAAHEIVDYIIDHQKTGPQMFIWGGETTVKLQGTGKGGRNQELALRVALKGDMIPGDWIFLSAGTDGRDGPTDAAGAIVDPKSIEKAIRQNINLSKIIDNNDSYTALSQIDALIKSGPTGTNVADIQIFLKLS